MKCVIARNQGWFWGWHDEAISPADRIPGLPPFYGQNLSFAPLLPLTSPLHAPAKTTPSRKDTQPFPQYSPQVAGRRALVPRLAPVRMSGVLHPLGKRVPVSRKTVFFQRLLLQDCILLSGIQYLSIKKGMHLLGAGTKTAWPVTGCNQTTDQCTLASLIF